MKPVYLDYNATAPIRPEVIEIMTTVLQRAHNASSIHSFGRNARKYVEDARDEIAKLTGTPCAQIIFNSGATEGNNTVLQHFARAYPDEQILVSAIEHPSVLEAVPKAPRIPVTKDGIVDLNALETLLKAKKTSLVSVMLVNNETGVIQPIKDISALVHKHSALLHCDGVQAAGRIEINIAKMSIDFLTLSAHKLGGPQGVGALCLGLCGITPVLLHGGGQEKSARAGTENVAGIAGFGQAAALAHENLNHYQTHCTETLSPLEIELCRINNLTIWGKDADRTPNTCLFTIPGIPSETLLMALDLEGIAVSNGSACSSGRVEPSHVLKAMGASNDEASSAIRVSIGWDTKPEDIKAFIAAFTKIHARIAAA